MNSVYQDIYNEIYHHGIKGMKWGVRRFQNPDGSLTAAGKQRYGVIGEPLKVLKDKHETAEVHENPVPVTAKFIAKLIPSVRESQKQFKDYTIKDKNGNKVGNISTNRDSKDTMNIIWLGIKGKHEGNGYAQSTLRQVIKDAKKQGVKRVTLEVPTTSPNARHIYEKQGFKEVDSTDIFDSDDIWGGLTRMELKIK